MNVVYVADCDEWAVVGADGVGRKFGFKTEEEAREFLEGERRSAVKLGAYWFKSVRWKVI